MRKWILIVGSIGILVFFVAVMISGVFLKNSITNDDDVMEQLNLIENSIKKNDWNKADKLMESEFRKWEKVKNRIQFSVERDFLEDIDKEFATLNGAIVAKDPVNSIITIEKIKKVWVELGK